MQGPRKTRLLFSALGLTVGAALLTPAVAAANFLTPESPASPNADDTQTAYVVMVIVSLVIAVALIAGLLSALRGRSEEEGAERRTRGTTGLQRQVGLGLGLLAIVVFIFGIAMTESARDVTETGPDGLVTAQADLSLPEGAEPLEIDVSGQQWLWRYEYPDGTFSYHELVVPVDTAVVLNLGSTDVLHRWWVPALGGMFDAAPESENGTWFMADETGTYEGRSTEFSGPGYATMRAKVTVLEPTEYEAWLEEQAAGIKEAQADVRVAVEDGTAPGVELETDGNSETEVVE